MRRCDDDQRCQSVRQHLFDGDANFGHASGASSLDKGHLAQRQRVGSDDASYVILGHGTSEAPTFGNLAAALSAPDTQLRLFGKPTVDGERRLGVGLALGATLDEARDKAKAVAEAVEVTL